MPRKKKAVEEKPKEIPLPNESTVLCVVDRLLGAEHMIARCADGRSRVVRIPGRMRRRVWIKEGDVILVAPWDFQPGKGDVLHRYASDEVKRLIEQGLLPKDFLEGAL